MISLPFFDLYAYYSDPVHSFYFSFCRFFMRTRATWKRTEKFSDYIYISWKRYKETEKNISQTLIAWKKDCDIILEFLIPKSHIIISLFFIGSMPKVRTTDNAKVSFFYLYRVYVHIFTMFVCSHRSIVHEEQTPHGALY